MKKYINECIDTTFVSSVGKFVDRFEDAIAKYTDANAVATSNGTFISSCVVNISWCRKKQ